MSASLRSGSSGVAYHATSDAASVPAPAASSAGSPPLNAATEFVSSTPVLVRSADEIRLADEAVLHEMGYKQELHRGFTRVMNFSFCFTAVAIVSSISVLFDYGLNTGGPAIIIWGWIIASAFTICIGLSLAEIAATYPSAGSVYHWAGQLATAEWAPFASFITGWFNFLGNAAGDASYAYGCAQLIAAVVALNDSTNPDPALSSTGAQVLLSIAIALAWAVKNCARVDQQGLFNNFSAVFQMVSTLVIVATLFIATPVKSSSEFVWQSTYNSTGMSSMLYVSLIGLLMSLFSFSGYEAGAHMSEETTDAQTSAPWSIVHTTMAAAVTGFVYLLGLLYAALSVPLVLNGASNSAVVNIYTQAFTRELDTSGWPATCPDPNCCDARNPACTLQGPIRYAGATFLSVLLLINIFFAGFASLTVTSRVGFAMVRDDAMPGSRWLHMVHPTTKAPLHMIGLTFIIDALLCCMPLVNSTAFAAITSITTVGYQISYAIPIILRLTASKHSFEQTSAFSLGVWSKPIGWISAVWLVCTSCLFFFPTQFDAHMQQQAASFNYTCVVVGGVMAIALVYWFLPKRWGGARWFFVGPKRKDGALLSEPLQPKEFDQQRGYVPLH